MTQERITPLRERMIEDMRIRGIGEKAQAAHIRGVKDFAALPGPSTGYRDAGRAASLSTSHGEHRGYHPGHSTHGLCLFGFSLASPAGAKI